MKAKGNQKAKKSVVSGQLSVNGATKASLTKYVQRLVEDLPTGLFTREHVASKSMIVIQVYDDGSANRGFTFTVVSWENWKTFIASHYNAILQLQQYGLQKVAVL